MAEEEINFLGQTNFRNVRRRFGIKTDDRRRHVYIIGKTGMGKTALMQNMRSRTFRLAMVLVLLTRTAKPPRRFLIIFLRTALMMWFILTRLIWSFRFLLM